MNTHRSPFGGRCNEYYSQDGYQGGMIGAYVIQGCQSKGVICYVKHCAMNDQEIYRMNLITLASEQAAREIYMKQFQLAIQEGGVAAIMTTYGSVGEYSGATNYNFMTGLIRNEWGFKGYVVTDAWMPCKDYWPLDMLVTQSCLTLWDPMDRSLLGSSVHGIFQARILAWVAMPSSRGFSQPRDQTQVSSIAGTRFTV